MSSPSQAAVPRSGQTLASVLQLLTPNKRMGVRGKAANGMRMWAYAWKENLQYHLYLFIQWCFTWYIKFEAHSLVVDRGEIFLFQTTKMVMPLVATILFQDPEHMHLCLLFHSEHTCSKSNTIFAITVSILSNWLTCGNTYEPTGKQADPISKQAQQATSQHYLLCTNQLFRQTQTNKQTNPL